MNAIYICGVGVLVNRQHIQYLTVQLRASDTGRLDQETR
jgi:hypothetical protein